MLPGLVRRRPRYEAMWSQTQPAQRRNTAQSCVAGKQPQNPASPNTRDAAKHTESNGCKSKAACEKASLLAAERRNIKPSICEMRCNSSNKRSTSRDIIVSFQQVRRQKVRQKRSSACDGLCRRKARKLVRLPFLIFIDCARDGKHIKLLLWNYVCTLFCKHGALGKECYCAGAVASAGGPVA